MANDVDRTNILLPRRLKRQAQIKAIIEGKSLSQAIRQLLRLWVSGHVELPREEEDPEQD